MIDTDKVDHFLTVCNTLRSGLSCEVSESPSEGHERLLINYAIALDSLIEACSIPVLKKERKK